MWRNYNIGDYTTWCSITVGSKSKSRKKVKRYLETNNNEETISKNLWNRAKTLIRDM